MARCVDESVIERFTYLSNGPKNSAWEAANITVIQTRQ